MSGAGHASSGAPVLNTARVLADNPIAHGPGLEVEAHADYEKMPLLGREGNHAPLLIYLGERLGSGPAALEFKHVHVAPRANYGTHAAGRRLELRLDLDTQKIEDQVELGLEPALVAAAKVVRNARQICAKPRERPVEVPGTETPSQSDQKRAVLIERTLPAQPNQPLREAAAHLAIGNHQRIDGAFWIVRFDGETTRLTEHGQRGVHRLRGNVEARIERLALLKVDNLPAFSGEKPNEGRRSARLEPIGAN